MRAGLSQTTQLKQEMKINPRLYQAMDLLYMPLLDLQQHLKQELLNNPFLELVEPEEDDDSEEGEGEATEAGEATDEHVPLDATAEADADARETASDSIDWEEILLDGFETGGAREEHETREYIEPVTVARRDLADHLRDQLALLDLSPRAQVFADEFGGHIN